MSTERPLPQPILELLDSRIDEVSPESSSTRELAERFPEYREEILAYAELCRRVRESRDTPDAGEPTGSRDLRERMRRQTERLLAVPSGPARTAAPVRRRPFPVRILAPLAAAAALLVGLFLFLDRDGPRESLVASVDVRTVRSGVEYRLEIRPGAARHLNVLLLGPDASARSAYPQLDAGGLVDYGVRGPFEPGDVLIFPPKERTAPVFELGWDRAWFFFVPRDEPPSTDGLRALLAEVERIARSEGDGDAGRVESFLKERNPDTLVREVEIP